MQLVLAKTQKKTNHIYVMALISTKYEECATISKWNMSHHLSNLTENDRKMKSLIFHAAQKINRLISQNKALVKTAVLKVSSSQYKWTQSVQNIFEASENVVSLKICV